MSRKKKIRTAACTAILLAMTFGPGASSAAAQVHKLSGRVVLLASVETSADLIRLSDLLPANVPVWLAELAPEIVLGHSPQPGSMRAFSQEQLGRAMADYPQVLAAIAIPSRVEVHSGARELSREEILSAIVRSLEASHVSTEEPLDERAVLRFPRVAVQSDASGLEVTQLEDDADKGLLRFRMWTAAEPAVRPFWVEARARLAAGSIADVTAPRAATQVAVHPALTSFAAQSEDHPTRRQYGLATADAAAPRLSAPLVEPGDPATILIQGSGLRIQASGIALERGWKGQRIHVRAVSTGKILLARVVGERMLLALF